MPSAALSGSRGEEAFLERGDESVECVVRSRSSAAGEKYLHDDVSVEILAREMSHQSA